MEYRMSEGMTNIGTPLKEAMERTSRPNTPLGLPLFWDAPAPRPDGSLINEGTKKPEQEPVAHFGSAYINENGVHITTVLGPVAIQQDAKLYTTPPQRTWVGLDAEEIRKTDHHMVDGAYHYSFKQGAEWAEAKLKEKNT